MCTALTPKVVTAMFSASVTCGSVTLEAVRGNMSYHHTQLCLRTGSRCRSLARIDSSSYLAKPASSILLVFLKACCILPNLRGAGGPSLPRSMLANPSGAPFERKRLREKTGGRGEVNIPLYRHSVTDRARIEAVAS
jgi:hypothetical protein